MDVPAYLLLLLNWLLKKNRKNPLTGSSSFPPCAGSTSPRIILITPAMARKCSQVKNIVRLCAGDADIKNNRAIQAQTATSLNIPEHSSSRWIDHIAHLSPRHPPRAQPLAGPQTDPWPTSASPAGGPPERQPSPCWHCCRTGTALSKRPSGMSRHLRPSPSVKTYIVCPSTAPRGTADVLIAQTKEMQGHGGHA